VATLSALNAMSPDDAQRTLMACCASRRWADAMAAARPFADFAAVHRAADRIWRELSSADWLEAFAAHPRIGERAPASAGAHASAWSASEQARAASSDATTLAELAQVNRDYEARFGHVFLVCAAGRSAADLLADARNRMHNDAVTELSVAAEEQRQITRLRLARLLEEGG
jgi:OHCU decarboxylase